METPPQIGCDICKNGAHHPSNCPELAAPLQEGFYSGGGGGGGGHSHEDDDEKAPVLNL